MRLPSSEAYPSYKAHFQEGIASLPVICSGGAWAASSVTVCCMYKHLVQFKYRMSFTMRCRPNSARDDADLVCGFPLPRPYGPSNAWHLNWINLLGSRVKKRGHQVVTRHPRKSEAK